MPFTRTRVHPCCDSSSSFSRWKPFCPRTTGASTISRVPSARPMMLSTICVLLLAAIATPERSVTVPSFLVFVGAHEYGFPQRAYRRRR